MKVELITLQRVPNYGSVLQAYATEKILESLGYEVETINYQPLRATMKGMLINLKNKNTILKKSLLVRTIIRLIMLPSYITRFNNFDKVTYKYLNMTNIVYKSNDELKKNLPISDIYITGSDQVWNSEWNGEIDKALFLDFIPKGKKCISYAASFGKIKLYESEKKETKKLLKKYSNISLREKSGLDILKSLDILNGDVVLDPTLLLNASEWRKISSNRFKNKKYILMYNLNRNKEIDNYAKKVAKDLNMELKYITYQVHDFYKYGKMYANTSVENFLSLIDNAYCVITDSFHGVAFSINFNTNFIVIPPKKFNTRIDNILNITNLTNRLVTDENKDIVYKETINFENINKIIEKERKKSISWLKNALK